MSTAASVIRTWREDPRLFVRQCIGATPDAWQDDVLAAFPSNPRIALKASKGPGKSTLLAWLVWNFLATRPHPKVACTSVSGDNLRDGLWTELAKWQGQSDFLKRAFQWGAERIVAKDHPETWWASARQWNKSADPSQQANTLAGLHAEYLLFVLDESGGIPEAVMSAAEGGLSTGKELKILQAGNPTHLSGPLYRACTRDRARWHVVEISGDPDDPKRAPRVSKEWARAQIEQYGRDNPWVLINVFGQFPPQQSNSLIGLDTADAAAHRTIAQSEWMREPKILGVDIARFGDDRTVLFPRQGRAAHKPKVFRNLDSMEVAGQVAMEISTWRPDAVFIDHAGVGAGVVDRLRELGHHVVHGVEFGGRALTQEPKMLNRRAEMWWLMAEWLKLSCIPDDGELRAELVAPTYRFDSSGRLVLESKDDMKKRGLPSPDKADALCLTFAMPVVSAEVMQQIGVGHAVTDYDPFAPERL